MLIFPAIDLYEGQAVRLYRGDYARKTVYSENPVAVAADFLAGGAEQVHIVDLEGAKSGTTPNFDLICRIKRETGLFCEVGGGIRSLETAARYLSEGIDRVILGTAAAESEQFVRDAVETYGDRIAVGIDIRDGCVAVKGWTESSGIDAFEFAEKMQGIGVGTMICTDISRDGAMKGANRELYRELSSRLSIRIIASGGVSSLDDIRALKESGLHGAILGKAYYTGAVSLPEAVGAAK